MIQNTQTAAKCRTR